MSFPQLNMLSSVIATSVTGSLFTSWIKGKRNGLFRFRRHHRRFSSSMDFTLISTTERARHLRAFYSAKKKKNGKDKSDDILT